MALAGNGKQAATRNNKTHFITNVVYIANGNQWQSMAINGNLKTHGNRQH